MTIYSANDWLFSKHKTMVNVKTRERMLMVQEIKQINPWILIVSKKNKGLHMSGIMSENKTSVVVFKLFT